MIKGKIPTMLAAAYVAVSGFAIAFHAKHAGDYISCFMEDKICSQQILVNGLTRVLYVAEEKRVHVCTKDKSIADKIMYFCRKYPDECRYVAETHDGKYFELPVCSMEFCLKCRFLTIETEYSL